MAILLPQPNSETTQSNNFFGYGWGELGRVGEIVLWRRPRQNESERHLRFGGAMYRNWKGETGNERK